jgi:hypothetical protein
MTLRGYPVVVQETTGALVAYEISDQTSTPTQVDFAGGLALVSIAYINISAADGDLIYVVFDATDDTDAATKLGSAGSREVVMLGERRTWEFDSDTPCMRIDVKSNVASETGDSLVHFSGKAPL